MNHCQPVDARVDRFEDCLINGREQLNLSCATHALLAIDQQGTLVIASLPHFDHDIRPGIGRFEMVKPSPDGGVASRLYRERKGAVFD